MSDSLDPVQAFAQKAFVVFGTGDRDFDEVIVLAGDEMRLDHLGKTR